MNQPTKESLLSKLTNFTRGFVQHHCHLNQGSLPQNDWGFGELYLTGKCKICGRSTGFKAWQSVFTDDYIVP